MPKSAPEYRHVDQLGQPIEPGAYVAFSHSYTPSALMGRVVRLTKMKVRVEYEYRYRYKGEVYTGTGRHITDPANTIVLGDGLQQHIVLRELQRR
jgi:hypothetical protein